MQEILWCEEMTRENQPDIPFFTDHGSLLHRTLDDGFMRERYGHAVVLSSRTDPSLEPIAASPERADAPGRPRRAGCLSASCWSRRGGRSSGSHRGNWCTPDTSHRQHIVFSPASGQLVIVPEPSTWVLACLGAAVVALRARRRSRVA